MCGEHKESFTRSNQDSRGRTSTRLYLRGFLTSHRNGSGFELVHSSFSWLALAAFIEMVHGA
jgi:hypothetical protein